MNNREERRRRVDVPMMFNGRKVEIPIYLVDSEAQVEDGVYLDVFVPIDKFLERVVDYAAYEVAPSLTPHGAKVDFSMKNYAHLCNGQGKCVTWKDLSKLGWALRRKDGQKDKLSLQVVFFAQCVMRGFLHRITQVEYNIYDCLEKGETIYWKPFVEAMRREVEAYRHVDQGESGLPEFVKDEVTQMWRRVKRQVEGQNKETLQRTLAHRKAEVIDMNVGGVE